MILRMTVNVLWFLSNLNLCHRTFKPCKVKYRTALPIIFIQNQIKIVCITNYLNMENQITKEDLRQFRLLLLNDMENLITNKKQGHTTKITEDPEWIRSKSIRQILNISPATLQNLRISGKIEYRKVLGSYYYKKEDLLRLFNK